MEDVESLKDFEIKDELDYYLPHEILEIKDTKDFPKVSHLVFCWLNPENRSRNGMGGWRWVKGELADYVRKHRIVQEATGGGTGTSLISNGDLVLGFMLRKEYELRKQMKKKRADDELRDVIAQDRAVTEGSARSRKVRQDVEPDIGVSRTVGGVDIGEEDG